METLEKLKSLSAKNEVRIDNFRGHRTTIPHYYQSLRQAFSFYFNTFITNNSSYSFYAEGLYNRNVQIFKYQTLDQDNTVLTIVAFERFFELFIKDLLGRVNKKLTLQLNDTNNKNRQVNIDRLKGGTQVFVDSILNGRFDTKKIDNKPLSIPFRETINRFYYLIEYSKVNPNSNTLIKKFTKINKEYSFLDSSIHKASFQYLNWYRDRILHNGNKLPSLWLLDYFISQKILPIVYSLLKVDSAKYSTDFFYFKTVTGIDILEKFNEIKFEFKDLQTKNKRLNSFVKLLKIGHLKELGRANMNMNLYVRRNKATYEYNYNDPQGRGKRFALAEKKHPDFVTVSECPCCGIKSLTLYRITIDDIFNNGEKIKIDWVKCYTCEYHLRYDTGEPYLLDLYSKPIFGNIK